MESVEKHVEQFLGVLLLLVVELFLELGDYVFEFEGRDILLGVEPQLLHQFGKSNRKFPLRAQWVRVIDLLLKVAFKEVL